MRVNRQELYKYAVRLITACIFLQNILLKYDDGEEDKEEKDDDEEDDVGEDDEGEDDEEEDGEEEDDDEEDDDEENDEGGNEEEEDEEAEAEPDEEIIGIDCQQLPAGPRKHDFIKTIVLGAR